MSPVFQRGKWTFREVKSNSTEAAPGLEEPSFPCRAHSSPSILPAFLLRQVHCLPRPPFPALPRLIKEHNSKAQPQNICQGFTQGAMAGGSPVSDSFPLLRATNMGAESRGGQLYPSLEPPLCSVTEPSLPRPCSSQAPSSSLYLSIMTGSEGVSFRLPQLFRSQHRLMER